MSWLSSFMHPSSPYKAAQEQLNKYYNQGQGYLDPYNQNGVAAGEKQTGYIDKLMDPAALQDEWNKTYKESEAAKQAERMAQEHGVNAASSMGLLGSNTAVNAIQAGTSQIGEQDRQKYLDDLMNKYTTGANLNQNMYNTGANAAGQESTNANQMGVNSAGVQFNEKNAPGERFGKTAGGIGKLILSYLTGGMGAGGFGRGAWS